MPAKILFFSLVMALGFTAQACGEYSVQGRVRKVNSEFFLVLNEKTKSEMRLKVPFKKDIPLYGFLDQFVSAHVVIRQSFDGTSGVVDEVVDPKLSRPAQWIEGRSTALTLIKAQSCQPAKSL